MNLGKILLAPIRAMGFILMFSLVILGVVFATAFAVLQCLFYKIQGKEISSARAEYPKEEWTLYLERKNFQLYSSYAGEVRFGPSFQFLRSEPPIPGLRDKYFGEWVHPFKKGILLQEWTEKSRPEANLVYIDLIDFELTTLKSKIPSVLWTVKSDIGRLVLWCDTGREVLRYEIDVG